MIDAPFKTLNPRQFIKGNGANCNILMGRWAESTDVNETKSSDTRAIRPGSGEVVWKLTEMRFWVSNIREFNAVVFKSCFLSFQCKLVAGILNLGWQEIPSTPLMRQSMLLIRARMEDSCHYPSRIQYPIDCCVACGAGDIRDKLYQ